MVNQGTIPVVDLFAGPGGLGEGFSSLENGSVFQTVVSAEMDPVAVKTLRLRAFHRRVRNDPKSAASYYAFCEGRTMEPFNSSNRAAWNEASVEALQLTLGNPSDNHTLEATISERLKNRNDWVLIGGPPCQAYSIAGRSRNQGKADYRPEEDHRHFLYEEYLRIIRLFRPAVFVMENVKGMLSASVGGQAIFHRILQDLARPEAKTGSAGRYVIRSLATTARFENGMDFREIRPMDFVIHCERHGIPQARHRVVLLGIREDFLEKRTPSVLERPDRQIALAEIIQGMPRLRSRLSKTEDSGTAWEKTLRFHLSDLGNHARLNGDEALAAQLEECCHSISGGLPSGSRFIASDEDENLPAPLHFWFKDEFVKGWFNHESRSHISNDLRRYVYAASFAAIHGRSPKGASEFALPDLRPNHANWDSGSFSDRFRVQLWTRPATTITSHISKDGHYFIHPDPLQCRSLTVREAARLQTFPDNYFFMGNRTQQYVQVGNAVPPLLARQIAEIVRSLFA